MTQQFLDAPQYRSENGWRPSSSHLSIEQLDYDRLRRIASALLRRERPGHSLQSEDLLHEVVLRWMGSLNEVQFRDWDHLRRSAATSMRRTLIDQARLDGTAKRGCRPVRIQLQPHLLTAESQVPNGIAVSQALERLWQFDKRKARVVELRVYSACSLEEIAEELALSTKTVRRDWKDACKFLRNELGAEKTTLSHFASSSRFTH